MLRADVPASSSLYVKTGIRHTCTSSPSQSSPLSCITSPTITVRTRVLDLEFSFAQYRHVTATWKASITMKPSKNKYSSPSKNAGPASLTREALKQDCNPIVTEKFTESQRHKCQKAVLRSQNLLYYERLNVRKSPRATAMRYRNA